MKRLTVTIPDELYNELYKLASKDMRTVSNELTYILFTHPVFKNK